MGDIHSAAPEHLPFFLPGADGSDPLLTAVFVILSIISVCVGALYLRIHSLPEHIGEKHNSAQLQLISVLVLLALFTHNNAFWVLALLIAVVRIPDFLTPVESIAHSLGMLVGGHHPDEKPSYISSPATLNEPGAELSAPQSSEEPSPSPKDAEEGRE